MEIELCHHTSEEMSANSKEFKRNQKRTTRKSRYVLTVLYRIGKTERETW